MFGLGFSELVLIFVVALIVFGPKRMPELAKQLGVFVGKMRNTVDSVKDEIALQVNMDEEKKSIDDMYKSLNKENEENEDAAKPEVTDKNID